MYRDCRKGTGNKLIYWYAKHCVLVALVPGLPRTCVQITVNLIFNYLCVRVQGRPGTEASVLVLLLYFMNSGCVLECREFETPTSQVTI